MLHLNNLVSDIKQINPVWTFSHYCNIPQEHFNGSTIKIKSIFKPEEKTPSFCIYYQKDTKELRFNDFSTSKSGDHINLVEQKFNLTYSQSCYRIMNDYTKWAAAGESVIDSDRVIEHSYKVCGYNTRMWNLLDKEYFTPFDIGSSRLEWGCVKALTNYKMTNGTDDIIMSGEYLYGYFTKTGELYKIYQPKHTGCKFITINNDYVAGSEHEEGNRYYGILSSWKDALSFKGLGLSIDLKVPSSENTFFSKEFMKELKRKYKGGFTLLDIDDAGIKAMLHYKNEHKINSVKLSLSKDFSDSIRDHGKQKVRNTVVPLIHKALN